MCQREGEGKAKRGRKDERKKRGKVKGRSGEK